MCFGYFSQTAYYTVYNFILRSERCPVQIRSDHNTGDYVPYSYQIVSGFFNVPYYLISNKGHETGPPVYSPYPRRLESLPICRCNYKGSTFSSVILRPWVLVRLESNSRPPTWQPMLNQLSHRCTMISITKRKSDVSITKRKSEYLEMRRTYAQ